MEVARAVVIKVSLQGVGSKQRVSMTAPDQQEIYNVSMTTPENGKSTTEG